ncbi:G-protein coupled receptor Mth2-like isoform X4 [Anoplophora glabripennis]|uniref:G-protein coupled receptor Mth2-like isoform X4 n=1 Tax=Anoplophora glabripennis TaxID=217634 RepID=UPI00087512BA|nr:G-protein coupled receptor Mth2-like isoform X4 [Anoplophora glabripennis]
MVYRALYLLTFLVTAVFSQQDRPCYQHLTEDITNGQRLPSGAILKNNVTYDSDNYYTDNGRVWGCICNINNCVQYCCDVDEVFVNKTCIQEKSHSELNISVYEEKKRLRDFSLREFSLIKSLSCPKLHERIAAEKGDLIYIQENGSLYYVSGEYEAMYDPGHYCLTRDASNTLLTILCEFYDGEIEETMKMYAKGMIISMPFLLATFLVYAILPESNLHRKALMNYVLTLFLAYIFLVIVQLYPGKFDENFVCPALGYLIIFFFLISFFWMNVMCLDMWFAFRGMRGFNGRRLAEKKRFLMYFAYAVGVPSLHILVVFLINKFGNNESDYFPGIGYEKCFLRDGLPNLLYFYGPMAILITVNVTLFILTAVKIQRVKKETSMLKQSDSKRHSYEDDKQKFNLYVKLLFAMGINWTMEVISWAIEWRTKDIPSYIWYLTDFCNAMYGVFIFFIFVFKKKIWRSLKKRYYVFIGKPHFAHSVSVTQTTRSSNYSTTETGLNDHRLSELNNGRGEERMLHQN